MPESKLLLGIDTCGPSGTVALGRLTGQQIEILGQKELEGRSYSSTLVAAIGEMLAHGGGTLREVGAIVAVNGPGSFTGVRVGLAAVKGLVEPTRIPVVAVSRLEVMGAKAGTPSSALDAHRNEVFLRLGSALNSEAIGERARELLAGAHEFAAIEYPPSRIALCDEAAALLLGAAWPRVVLVQVEAPTAADALTLCAPRVAAEEFVDVALLDGHYLRRSDAEIFGEAAAAALGR
ncbi:MAG: tRNA (adenosine(37)-N6)-threonylcarbamoyltransferase complex dimerization subunit type 1 TsaB [Terracidiphilus sp.]|jgi:tRNA threonylcarbamoyladenosine biosynthesis protein TsaB